MNRRLLLAVSLVLPVLGLLPPADPARAAEHQVQMLSKGPDGQRNWFEPPITYAEPGDTVTFVAVDKGHNSASVVIPDGAEAWNGKLSQDVATTVAAPGLYAFKCTPHFGLGMVGLIVVGDPSVNLAAVEGGRYPGKARAAMSQLLDQVKAKM